MHINFFEKQDLKLSLFFYLLNNIPHKLVRNKTLSTNAGVVWVNISRKYITYLSLHYRFMVFLGLSQLCDIFSYERLDKFIVDSKFHKKETSNVVVYNFHNFLSRRRYFIVTTQKIKTSLFAVSNIFISARWLERELIEMSGVSLRFAFDCRPLLLDYSSLITPLLKNISVIGTSELMFDVCTGSISKR